MNNLAIPTNLDIGRYLNPYTEQEWNIAYDKLKARKLGVELFEDVVYEIERNEYGTVFTLGKHKRGKYVYIAGYIPEDSTDFKPGSIVKFFVIFERDAEMLFVINDKHANQHRAETEICIIA